MERANKAVPEPGSQPWLVTGKNIKLTADKFVFSRICSMFLLEGPRSAHCLAAQVMVQYQRIINISHKQIGNVVTFWRP